MDAAVVTVGDELLAGEVENTNATWLARQLADRGVDVLRITTVPDTIPAISRLVRLYADRFDAVVVTGGLGATPDDVTMSAVATAFDRELAVDETARASVLRGVEDVRRRHPDFSPDIEAEATIPAGSRPLPNPNGISPGCVVANVYVLPGIPREMKAMFDSVADEFDGTMRTMSLSTSQIESHIASLLREVKDEFGVHVGSYPNPDGGDKRVTVTSDDEDRLEAAYDALVERLGER